jgi:hypothetical protein
MRNVIVAAAALGLLAGSAFAADMPLKAPPAPNPLYTGYPYGTSGLFYGAYAEGGGGPVNGNGVNTLTGVSTAASSNCRAGSA